MCMKDVSDPTFTCETSGQIQQLFCINDQDFRGEIQRVRETQLSFWVYCNIVPLKEAGRQGLKTSEGSSSDTH